MQAVASSVDMRLPQAWFVVTRRGCFAQVLLPEMYERPLVSQYGYCLITLPYSYRYRNTHTCDLHALRHRLRSTEAQTAPT